MRQLDLPVGKWLDDLDKLVGILTREVAAATEFGVVMPGTERCRQRRRDGESLLQARIQLIMSMAYAFAELPGRRATHDQNGPSAEAVTTRVAMGAAQIRRQGLLHHSRTR